MNVDTNTIRGLDSFLRQHQESDVAQIISEKLNIPAGEALEIYFESKVASMVEKGIYGAQYLSSEYLAEEILEALTAN